MDPKSVPNGGPAFPGKQAALLVPAEYKDDPRIHEIARDCNGMSLRDYFIAHAPTEPQPWFKPVMPPRPVGLWRNPSGTRTYESLYAARRECGDDCFNTKADEIKAWDEEQVKQLHVQWPVAWADAMLKAREA